jgi:hypothetical protein
MITLWFHLEVDECGQAYWTINSPELPSLCARSTRLVECRQLALDALTAAGHDHEGVACVLVEHH